MKTDILTAIHPEEALHPQFRILKDSAHFEPARVMLREMCRQLDDPDGNFVEQFQTFGFDARTFEIFLSALFQEGGHTIDRSHQYPDFLLKKAGIEAAVEAVTAGPKQDGTIHPYDHDPTGRHGQDLHNYFRHEVAIRLGSPLFSKLKRKYWEKPHIKGKPLIFAIEAFHEAGSLGLGYSSLSNYLYGISQSWYRKEDGELGSKPNKSVEVRIGY